MTSSPYLCCSCTGFNTLPLSLLHQSQVIFQPQIILSLSSFIFANTALPSCNSTFSSHNLFSIKLQPFRIECCYICAPGRHFVQISSFLFLIFFHWTMNPSRAEGCFSHPFSHTTQQLLQNTFRKMYVELKKTEEPSVVMLKS